MSWEWFDFWRLSIAIAVSTLIVIYAHKRKSLSFSGCVAAFITGVIHFYAGQRFGIILLSFFLSSSKLTTISAEKQKKPKESRSWQQVLCNSVPASICCLLYFYSIGYSPHPYPIVANPQLSSFSIGAFLSFYASATGDTWSSELGTLSKTAPILITDWRRVVPKGTNGGITVAGVAAAIVAGFYIGLTFWLSTESQINPETADATLIGSNVDQMWCIAIATGVALCGTLFDSLLGAIFQYSGWDPNTKSVVNERVDERTKQVPGTGFFVCLSNNQVNLITNSLMCVFGGLVTQYVFSS